MIDNAGNLVAGHAGDFNPQFSPSRLLRVLKIAVIGRHPKLTLIRISVLVLSTLLLFKFVLLPIRVTGISMLPTYSDHSINLVNRLAYIKHPPQRGDVVNIRFAENSDIRVTFLKRIIGLPGDVVSFSAGHAFINGHELKEPYLRLPCDWNCPPVRLKNDECFVVGDNRSMPPEDHWHGKISLRRIVGKVLL